MVERDPERIPRWLDRGLAVGGLSALGLLLVELGFPLGEAQRALLLRVVEVVLWVILVMEGLRLALHPRRRWYLREHRGEALLAGGVGLLLGLRFWAVPALAERWPNPGEVPMRTLYLTIVHVLVIGLMGYRLLFFNRVLAFARVSPRLILIGSYVGLIVLGALLLMLPNSTTAPGALSWLDALFTSTSAVCVTGLIVVDTATAFSPMGQTILLGLIQLGGLGLMTFTYFFVSVFGGGMTLRDRALLLDFLNEEHVGRITQSLVAIVGMTLAFELVGTGLLYAAAPAGESGAERWFGALFHAVSAFCNAGFSLYSLGLFEAEVRASVGYQFVIMGLIVGGGLGFPVLKNGWDQLWSRVTRPQVRAPRLTTHSRVVLITTAGLIVGGALGLWLLEYGLGDQPAYTSSVVTALFNSVTARTAGFNTVPVESWLPSTTFLMIFLMFIGGSPASTAGGIKTTTFAVALLNTLRILRGGSAALVAFGRQIPPHIASRAFAVALLGIAWVAGATLVLSALMPWHAPLDLAFEAVSAFSTVGLSRGVTADLTPAGKAVIIASMIVGRIGILYVALGVLRKERPGRIAYPEEPVIIS